MNEEELPADSTAITADNSAWDIGWSLRGFNGPMRRAREKLGYSQKQIAVAIGVSISSICHVELLKMRPSNELRSKIATFLNLPEQSIWPDWLEPRDKSIAAVAYQEIDEHTYPLLDRRVRGEVRLLEDRSDSPEEEMDREVVSSKVREILCDCLNPREMKIVEMCFGMTDDGVTYTQEEMAEVLGISSERVRQIISKVFQKLQHPSRAKLLQKYL